MSIVIQKRKISYEVWEDFENFTDKDKAFERFEEVSEEGYKLNIASNCDNYRLKEGLNIHYFNL